MINIDEVPQNFNVNIILHYSQRRAKGLLNVCICVCVCVGGGGGGSNLSTGLNMASNY